jgi:hypothetical protein
MTEILMQEWLTSFYAHIGDRKVLLFMDNFAAHLNDVELSPPPPANVRIVWFPANSISRFQPLDQGIIQNFKTFYRE